MDDLVTEVISNLLKENINAIASLGKSSASRAKEQLLVTTGRAFKKYYKQTREKYSFTKTILYRTVPVPLYDYYVHLDLAHGDAVVPTAHAEQPLKVGRHFVVTGTAGSGKSTLMRHLFLDALQAGSHLPLYIELRLLNDCPGQPLIRFMHQTLERLGLEISNEQFVKLLEGGKFLVLLDAFDELNVELTKTVQTEILNFRDQYGQNSIVLSSRPDERFVGWNSFVEFQVLPLAKDKVLELISKLQYDEDIKRAFYTAVSDSLYNSHGSFLQIPLLVTLMLMTYDQFGDIPGKTHLFYAQVFDTLFSKHDASKSGYRREILSKLAADDFQDVLSAFALITYFESQLSFSRPELLQYLSRAQKILGDTVVFSSEDYLGDLLQTLCILLQDGLHYVFAHRTFQEYFAARFIVKIPSEQRRALLQRAKPRIGNDNLIVLAWEMDRRAIEDDFLVHELEAIAAATEWRELPPDESFGKFMILFFSEINISEDYDEEEHHDELGLAVTIRDITRFEIRRRVLELYGSPKPPFGWITTEEVSEFLESITAAGFTAETPLVINLPGDVVGFQPVRPLVYEWSDFWEREELRVSLLRLMRIYQWQFECLMTALDQIRESKDTRSATIEELLLASPTQKQRTWNKH